MRPPKKKSQGPCAPRTKRYNQLCAIVRTCAHNCAQSRGMMTERAGSRAVRLYRADASVPTPCSFATTLAAAAVYQDNPPFGGPWLYRAEIQPPEAWILDVYALGSGSDEALSALVAAAGCRHPGAASPAAWLSMPGGPAARLRAAGYRWVRIADDFPCGAETWTWIGDADDFLAGDEPELEEA